MHSIQQNILHFFIECGNYQKRTFNDLEQTTNKTKKVVKGALAGIGYAIGVGSLLFIAQKKGYPLIGKILREFYKVPSTVKAFSIVQQIGFIVLVPFANMGISIFVPTIEEILFRD